MIELKNVCKYYNNGDITNLGLRNVNLKLERNEIVAITGESGSGKSTLLNVITKIDNFDEGEIYYLGNETSYFSISDMDDFRKNKVGFIFQNYNILDAYTVLENVMLPLILKGYKTVDAKAKALSLIEKVGLKGREHHRGTKLSGGEKQRCVIARALASDCDILACDEPTGNLDSKTAKEIIKLITEVAKDKLVLIVTHNYEEVSDVVTRRIRVADGEVIEDVKFKELPLDENIPIDLDYVPLAKKIDYTVAKNNITFTPKKTILVSLIIMIICFIFLTDLKTIGIVEDAIAFEQNVYQNTMENELLVYHSDKSALDMKKLENYDCEVNNFLNQRSISYMVGNEYFYSYVTSNLSTCTLKEGRMPENENEFVMIFPALDIYDIKLAKNVINEKLKINVQVDGEEYYYGYTDTEFTLVGVCTYNASLATSDTYISGSKKLHNYLNLSLININAFYSSDDNFGEIYNIYQTAGDKITLVLPTELKGEELTTEVNIYGYKITDYEVQYDENNYNKVLVGKDYSLDKTAFVANIVTNKIDATKHQIKKLGFSCDELTLTDPLNVTLSVLIFVMKFFLTGGILFKLFVIFFISYLILSRIYSSKAKDYEILRTLGVTKKDMSKIVKYEVILIGMIVSVLSFLLYFIITKTVPVLSSFSKYSLYTIVVYFAAMYVFSNSLGHRFNVKLFRFTLSKSMKGIENDD